ncbi:hypothetical protein HanXRQr2_Chr06g0264731 [Helianthus annuus]|uniref:Uncharacterized protein n=1 Tax=Helianthus annuus TaxID=4232 RepID=A0A9K3ITU0_HELAN|nr:hypothetical protein HanXRQr2_Chr06g0264731 [Helianthus annuus]KAJ0915905.1 hypothetical protein HanPSC8_Chr06g0255301 [Helianthus annuus]
MLVANKILSLRALAGQAKGGIRLIHRWWTSLSDLQLEMQERLRDQIEDD